MLIRQSFFYIIAKLLPGALGLLATACLTRILDPTQFGIYGIGLLVMSLGSSVAFEWLGITLLRFYESTRDFPMLMGTFSSLLIGLLAAIGLLGCCLYGFGMISPGFAPIYLAGMALLAAYAWFEFVATIEIAGLHSARYLRMNLARGVFAMVCSVGAAWVTRDPVWAIAGTALGTFAASLFGRAADLRSAFGKFDPAIAREILRFGLPIALSVGMAGGIMSGTRALVGILHSAAELGLFTAAFTIAQNSLAIIAAGIASATYPQAVRVVERGNPAAIRRQLTDNCTVLLAVMVPACIGMMLTAGDIASVMLGPQFSAAAARIIPWMAAGALFGSFRQNYIDHAFQLGHRSRSLAWVTVSAAATAIVVSLAVIPSLGAVGAAIARTAAMVVSGVHGWIVSRRVFPMPFPAAGFAKVLAGTAVMSLAVLLVPIGGMGGLAAKVVLGGAAYSIVVVSLDLLGLRRSLGRWVARWQITGRQPVSEP